MANVNQIRELGRRLIRGFGFPDSKFRRRSLGAVGVSLLLATLCGAQSAPADGQAATPSTPAAQPAPAPLSTPAMTGPLLAMPPATVTAGPFGKFAVTGVLNGMGLVTGNHVPGDDTTQAALANGQVFIQKTDGWLQLYLQAGVYDTPSLGTAFLPTDKTVSELFGPLPVAYLQLVPAKNTSILVGELPTLIGAEYTFSFQNMDVVRGLLWNQENAVNRGIQVNQSMGPFSASLSWNDGFYSNRYSWLTGLLSYSHGSHSIAFAGGGNMGQTVYQTSATPVLNNSVMYNVIYGYTKGPWIIQSYFQYTDVPTNPKVGVTKGASTRGVAVLVSHSFKRGFSLSGRWEYITSTGSVADQSINLLFGPGSSAWSATVTPTFQYGGFFFRGDISVVRATNYTPGDVFGPNGMDQNQARAAGEIGFIFGNNITEKP